MAADTRTRETAQDITPQAALIPAIGYIRVSMWREEAISPEIQKAAIKTWAARRKRRIVDWIEDLDKTGRNFNRRVMEAIARIESGEAREIAVWKYSRFGRSRHGCAVNLARIEAAGGQLESATEEVDARTATGKLQRGMLMEFNAYQSDALGESWQDAKAHRHAAGLPGSARPRFGYVRKGRVPDPENPRRTRRDMSDPLGERYEPDPRTGPVLREMYLTYTAGDTPAVIATRLNDAGIRNTRGTRWAAYLVRRTLDSGFGAGYLILRNPECGCGKGRRCQHVIRIAGAHKPVITEPEWQAYLRKRAAASSEPPRTRAPRYALTGLLVCGHCGAKGVLKASHGTRRTLVRCSRWDRYKDCPSRGASVPYDGALAAVIGWLEDEDIRLAGDQGVAAAQSAITSARARAGQLQAELAKADRSLARLLARQAREEDVPADAWAGAKEDLLAERRQAAEALSREQQRAEGTPPDVRPVILTLLETWELSPAARLRELLAGLISAVVVWREDGKPACRVFPVWEPPWEGPGTAGIPG